MTRRGIGYPLPIIPYGIPTPRKQLFAPPEDSVPNPAGYFTQVVDPPASSGATLVDVPDVSVLLQSPNYFNCIQVEAQCQRGNRGWCVPDLFVMTIWRDQCPAPFAVRIDGTVRADAILGVNGPDYLNLTQNYKYHPNKTILQPIVGDPYSNSSTLFGTRVFSYEGLQPFRFAWIAYWMDYQSIHTAYDDTHNPVITVRAWYDPSVRTLKGS